VRVGPRSSLAAVAVTVGDALRRHGIHAVLTGGACASLYTHGAYQSRDMDFIVAGAVTQPGLDRAMASVGFHRSGDRYVHPQVLFYVEFPRGPLAIGDDYQIVPVTRSTAAGRALVLSATDSCRDRLAAFYHWNDRQSLDVAVSIARRNRIDRSHWRNGFKGSHSAVDFFRCRQHRSFARRPVHACADSQRYIDHVLEFARLWQRAGDLHSHAARRYR